MSELPRPQEHVAALFHSDDFIVERIASFIAEGLTRGEHVLALCTIEHWNAIARRLDSQGVAYGHATSDGRLVFLDADELLATITHDGRVSVDRFRDLLGQLLRPGAKTRVYGEVVSLLAQRGDLDGAIHVESLGQQLARTRPVAILCGYDVNRCAALGPAAMMRIRELHDRSFRESDVP
jgi:hypothetical protein